MSSQASNNLKQLLRERIQEKGPMPVSEYMGLILGHPEWGYYMRQDPLGHNGDFTTAPEISQMFGEMIGLWLADIWMQSGSPGEFILLECGPGRGTLMSDALRATKGVKGFHDAVQLHLLETSCFLKEKQKQALNAYNTVWHETIKTLPDNAPIFMVANEFFDALPIDQYEFTSNGWCERKIGFEGDAFVWVLEQCAVDPIEGLNLPKPEHGKIFEAAPIRNQFMQELSSRIYKQGGAALVIDYGHLRSGYGDTFQAVYKHDFVDVLSHIGDADLTSHVNFDELENAALEASLEIWGKETQGEFLKKLGIQVYASKLLSAANEKQADDIQKALHRLTHSDEMGSLFKVMGVGYGTNIKPAGF